MSTQVKLGLYVVTLVGTLLFGTLFLRVWRRADPEVPVPKAASAQASARAGSSNRPPAKAGARKAAGAPGAVATNLPAAGTDTNAPAAATPAPSEAGEAAEGTEGATDSADAGGAEATPERESVPETHGLASRSRDVGDLILWGLLGVASLLGLGGLIAYDTANYLGHRAANALFDHDGEDLPESAYEKVEAAYAKGEFLDAVRLLREFLAENPKAVHAKIRIAEIYEKDLNNPVAATLEYEEVLKYRIEPERRGWAAIHLVNLYNRLDKPDLAVAWMKRVVVECPNTPAAAKARERLAASGIEIDQPPAAGESEAGPTDSSASGLPPGFRPRG